MPMRQCAHAATMLSKADIAAEIIAQVIARGVGRTICPSEVARAMAQDWRGLMPDVRAVADDLVQEGLIVVTQKGSVV